MSSTEPGSSSEPRKQRRRYERTKTAVEVELHLQGHTSPLRAKTADLSLGGCYLEIMFTLPVGTKLKLVLWINDAKLNVDGVVVTCDVQVGNGIQFTGITSEDCAKLQQYLAAISDASPKP
ncbi:MAG TPA: PilZ domain-containing protein [Terriglobales bacterium]|nr:PilZ domain-containing protein [Terriglobales bacterium]